MREFRLHGFGRGAVSNDRPYHRAFPGLTQSASYSPANRWGAFAWDEILRRTVSM